MKHVNAEGTSKSAERLAQFTDADERAIAEYLEGLGRKVAKNPLEGVQGAGRQGDAFVDGLKTEFKTINRQNPTANTLKNFVNDSLRGEGQARQIVIDVRGIGLTKDMAENGIYKALGIGRDKLDYVTVIGDEFFIGYGVK